MTLVEATIEQLAAKQQEVDKAQAEVRNLYGGEGVRLSRNKEIIRQRHSSVFLCVITICKVGQNRVYAPYMTVNLVNSQPKKSCTPHRYDFGQPCVCALLWAKRCTYVRTQPTLVDEV